MCSFLCSVGWHPVIADAEDYDILATKGNHILRIKVKSCSGPIIGIRERAPGYYRWTIGLGRRKDILIPTDYYDVLALGPNAIQFVNAKDVNKKTYRTKPGELYAELARNTWREITDAL